MNLGMVSGPSSFNQSIAGWNTLTSQASNFTYVFAGSPRHSVHRWREHGAGPVHQGHGPRSFQLQSEHRRLERVAGPRHDRHVPLRCQAQ